MKNAEGTVIYVGKAKNLKNRIKQYFSPGRDGRAMIPFLTAEVAHIDTLVVSHEKEALLLENTLIKKHQPKFNALLKDDKTFIHLMINHKNPWPRIQLVRFKGQPSKEALYFGPYTNALAARHTFDLLAKLFPLRQCTDQELKRRERPCLLYSIKRCIAPCVQKCSHKEYDTYVKGAINFLKGHDKTILKELKSAMELASSNLEFEKAASLLQTIRQIEHVIQGKGIVTRATQKDSDVFSLYRQGDEVMLVQLFFRDGNLTGSEHYAFSHTAQTDEEILSSFILQLYQNQPRLPEEILLPLSLPDAPFLSEILSCHILSPKIGHKKKLLQLAHKNAQSLFEQEKTQTGLTEKMLLDLQDKLHLSRYPQRIECFDISNISGTDLVASLIAFTSGEKDKKRTRLFKIKNIDKNDDYAAMHQVLSRRLIRGKEESDLPDLIIVDGGKGQLSIALDVLKELDIVTIDLISLAKEDSRHDKGMTKERVFIPYHTDPITLDDRSPLLFFLQKIRDETHRKAISFHRHQRSKRTLASSLDSLPGIGPIKKQRLLQHFGSPAKIKAASPEELLKVKGITQKDINTLRSG
jgi:excinuclease ABC subunit C